MKEKNVYSTLNKNFICVKESFNLKQVNNYLALRQENRFFFIFNSTVNYIWSE